jgi:2-keto-4-pentenoate hydratase
VSYGPAEAAAAAAALWACWSEGRRLDALPDSARPPDLATAFAAQTALEPLAGPVIGWKIAATSVAGQRHIGVSAPLPGRLFERFLSHDGATLDSDHLHMAVVEAEFAFRMAGSPERADGTRLTRAQVLEAVDAMLLAIEAPESRFEDFEHAGPEQLLADAACAGRFVLGREVPGWADLDLAALPTRIEIDGRTVAEGVGANVFDDPREALTWIANDLLDRGTPLRAGDIVTTGTTTVPQPIAPGIDVTADFGALGRVRVRFA